MWASKFPTRQTPPMDTRIKGRWVIVWDGAKRCIDVCINARWSTSRLCRASQDSLAYSVSWSWWRLTHVIWGYRRSSASLEWIDQSQIINVVEMTEGSGSTTSDNNDFRTGCLTVHNPMISASVAKTPKSCYGSNEKYGSRIAPPSSLQVVELAISGGPSREPVTL